MLQAYSPNTLSLSALAKLLSCLIMYVLSSWNKKKPSYAVRLVIVNLDYDGLVVEEQRCLPAVISRQSRIASRPRSRVGTRPATRPLP